MKMWPGAAAAIAHPGNQITLTDAVTDPDKNLAAMRVSSFVAIRMLNFNHQPVSA